MKIDDITAISICNAADWTPFLSAEVREARGTGNHLTFEPLLAELILQIKQLNRRLQQQQEAKRDE